MRDRHISKRLRTGLAEGSLAPTENAELADHLFRCTACWQASISALSELDARTGPDAADPALAALLQKYRLEQRRLEERLLAHAAIGELRHLTRKGRREEIAKRKAFRTRAVVEELLAEARRAMPIEAEEWSSVAILLCRQLSPSELTEAARHDLMAECYAELASARRRAGRWTSARQAIQEGREQAAKGSNDPAIEGSLRALEGVIDGDIGSLDDAENSLLAAKDLFEEVGDASMLGKVLAQLAYIWIDANPEKSLRYLREARAIIPSDEIRLITLCEINRTDCLITLGLTKEALLAFSEIARLCEQFTDPFVQLRLRFLEGRLLEAIERYKEADVIFREVIAADLDQRSIKAYFLDLAYLFDSYIRRGDSAGAVGVCNEALAQIDILELGNSAEEPIRDLWEGLKDRAERGAIKGNLVERSRKYIRSQWSFLGGDPLASNESAVK